MEIQPQTEITTSLFQDSLLRKETIHRNIEHNIHNLCNNSTNCQPIKTILPNIYIDNGLIIDRMI